MMFMYKYVGLSKTYVIGPNSALSAIVWVLSELFKSVMIRRPTAFKMSHKGFRKQFEHFQEYSITLSRIVCALSSMFLTLSAYVASLYVINEGHALRMIHKRSFI